MASRQQRWRLANLQLVQTRERARLVTNVAAKRFYCDLCNKALSTKYNLNAHITMSKEPANLKKQEPILPILINNPININAQPIPANE